LVFFTTNSEAGKGDASQPSLAITSRNCAGNYLAKLRGSFQPYRTRYLLDPSLDNQNPDWQFIHLPDALPNLYGIVPAC
jgi:hypothetical protein